MEKLTANKSAIWVYNALELVFSAQDQVEILRLMFRRTHEREYSDGSIAFAPLSFTDVNPCQVAELTAFTEYLKRSEIDHQQSTDRHGSPIITTAGTISRFSKVLHYDESVKAQRAIRSEHDYLSSITASIMAPAWLSAE